MRQNLSKWLTFFETLHPSVIDLSLERVKKVASRLDLVDFASPIILVGGTNGKGSTVAFLSSIYQKAGYRVGTYTSPHLISYCERICIQGTPVSENALCDAFTEINHARGTQTLTYFEAGTLAALFLFKFAKLDVMILEVGLGGRLDAVNIVSPELSIITTISLDHTQILGCDRESIAFEKAGIMRTGKVCICGDPNPPNSLLEQAKKIGAPLWVQGRDFTYQVEDSKLERWFWRSSDFKFPNLPIPHLPIQNASTAIAGISALQKSLPVSSEAIAQGLKDTFLIGRFQRLSRNPDVIVDVAHNPESADYLAEKIRQMNCMGKVYAVFAMLKDKDHENTFGPLLPWISTWFVASLSGPRGESTANLAAKLHQHQASVVLCDSVILAAEEVLKSATPEDAIIAFGSFYTVEALFSRYAMICK